TGITFGMCFGRRQTAVRILSAITVNQIVYSLLLNTLWISILYSSPFIPLLATRVLQCAVLGPVQFITILGLSGFLNRYGKKTLT
ncbi:MAG: folate family ECF transporter S component, partial [Lawsonibacter sp.]